MKKTKAHAIIGIIFFILIFIDGVNAQTLDKLKTTYDKLSGITVYNVWNNPLDFNGRLFLPYICEKDGKYWMRLRIFYAKTLDGQGNISTDILKIKKYKFSFDNRDYHIKPPEGVAQMTSAYGYIEYGKEITSYFITGHDFIVTEEMMPILEEISKLKSNSFFITIICEEKEYPVFFLNSIIDCVKKVYFAYTDLLNKEKTKQPGSNEAADLKALQELIPGKVPKGTADFRNIRWGMKVKELMESEDTSPLNAYVPPAYRWPFKSEKWSVLHYEDTIFGFPVLLTYHISFEEVYFAIYHIKKPYANNEFSGCMNDFNLIKESLIKKYGPGKDDFLDGKGQSTKVKPEDMETAILNGLLSYTVKWRHKDTDITLTIKQPKKSSSAFEISIGYMANKLKPPAPIDPDKM